MLEIDFIRHAQSVANTNLEIIHGQANGVPLTQLGFNQCEALDDRLKKENRIYDEIHCSTAVRAIQTRKYGLKSQPNEKHSVESEDLLEIDQGNFAGKKRTDVYNKQTLQEIIQDPWHFRPENGESQAMVGYRMWKYTENIRQKYLARNADPNIPYKVAIVTHGVAVKCWIRKLLNFDPNHTWLFHIDNTSISRFAYMKINQEYVWAVKKINDTAHIKEIEN